jgi:flagellar assembly factor FliW
MQRCQTKEFGEIEYDESAVVHFPAGLPAFENEKRFLLIEQAESAPVVFLQSLSSPQLLFLALPARFVDPAFRLELHPEDRQALGLAPQSETAAGECAEPVEGRDLLSLALLTVREGSAVTANLLAPVVIGAHSRRALQIVLPESGYRVDHPLAGAAASC